jgi:hypothetical protein
MPCGHVSVRFIFTARIIAVLSKWTACADRWGTASFSRKGLLTISRPIKGPIRLYRAQQAAWPERGKENTVVTLAT